MLFPSASDLKVHCVQDDKLRGIRIMGKLLYYCLDFRTCGSIFSQVWHGAAEGAATIYLTTDKAVTKSYLKLFELF